MDSLSKSHDVKRMLQEDVFYPPHSPRTESPAYEKAHRHLTEELDLPCIVCGVKNSTLNDPVQNWVNAKAIETHHHNIEWALQNSIDLAKFNLRIIARLKVTNPTKYVRDLTQQEMLDWIDHDPDNLWVVCDVHHRHSLVGIHSVTFPVWNAQDLIIGGTEYTPTEVIK